MSNKVFDVYGRAVRKCSLCSQTGHDKRSCTNNFEVGDLVKVHYHRNLRTKDEKPKLGIVTAIREEDWYGNMGPYVSVTWLSNRRILERHSGAHACYLRMYAKAKQ
jgi:hypothetical protein